MTGSIDKLLIVSAGVDAGAPLGDGIVDVPVGTLRAGSIDTVKSVYANALQRVLIKDLIGVASVAMLIRAGCNFCRWLATEAVVGGCCYYYSDEQI